MHLDEGIPEELGRLPAFAPETFREFYGDAEGGPLSWQTRLQCGGSAFRRFVAGRWMTVARRGERSGSKLPWLDFPRREELRATFEDVAPLYHRARPRYPESLFNDLLEITRLVPPSRLLEIGSGTGIATLVLAQRGFRIVGVEMEEGMARAARENLAGCEWVEIVTASYETYVPHGCFEAVLAFSAFHWIDPSERYRKAASLLRESGFLVVADARHVVSEDGDPLLTELDADYEGVLGERAHAPGAPGLASLRDEINESGLFSHIAERRYRWELTYTAEAYIDLLDTFPWYRALELAKRAELYALILRRIRERGAGRVAVMFEAVLDVGRAA